MKNNFLFYGSNKLQTGNILQVTSVADIKIILLLPGILIEDAEARLKSLKVDFKVYGNSLAGQVFTRQTLGMSSISRIHERKKKGRR